MSARCRRLHSLTAALLVCWVWTGVEVGRVVDGDTFDAKISLAPGHVWYKRIRVLGVDTPELEGATKPAALAAKTFAESWLRRGEVTIAACKEDSFGRLLGDVTRDGENLAQQLIGAGLGKPR